MATGAARRDPSRPPVRGARTITEMSEDCYILLTSEMSVSG